MEKRIYMPAELGQDDLSDIALKGTLTGVSPPLPITSLSVSLGYGERYKIGFLLDTDLFCTYVAQDDDSILRASLFLEMQKGREIYVSGDYRKSSFQVAGFYDERFEKKALS